MDREIEFLCKFHPYLRPFLRRNRTKGCLEYRGPLRGKIVGNPILFTRVRGKGHLTLLRRRVWILHNGPLPRNRFVVMTCGNHACHSIRHAQVSSQFHPYRNNFLINNPDYPKEYVLLIRHFKGLLPALVLSRWFTIPYTYIEEIWENRKFTKIRIPRNYHPPDSWVRKAERYSFHSTLFHYLGPNNRKDAEIAIRSSQLAPRTKKILFQYLQGDNFREIADTYNVNTSSAREIIVRALVRMHSQVGPRDWLNILLKGKVSL